MKKLLVVMGPTAVGKTAFAIDRARQLDTEILSCDSRQCYRELDVGVARPSKTELQAAKHHFIACRSISTPYNAWQFAEDATSLLVQLFANHEVVVAVGGSNLYVEALCHGIAPLPDPAPGLREQLTAQLATEGIGAFQQRLQALDPVCYASIDVQNPARLQRALEVCITTGRPYSELIERGDCHRDFEVEKVVLSRNRDVLRERIAQRVDKMMEEGLLKEVSSLRPYRNMNTLNTVGYKELFAFLDGDLTLPAAVQQIKDHTWQYAKKQLTWLRKYEADAQWVALP